MQTGGLDGGKLRSLRDNWFRGGKPYESIITRHMKDIGIGEEVIRRDDHRFDLDLETC